MVKQTCDVDYKSKLSLGEVKKNQSLIFGSQKNIMTLREAHLNKNRSKVDPCNKCNVI